MAGRFVKDCRCGVFTARRDSCDVYCLRKLFETWGSVRSVVVQG